MTTQQLVSLITLNEMLQQATETGLLDELAAYVHPDTINSFCDAVMACFKDQRLDP